MQIKYIEWKNFLSNNEYIKIDFEAKYYQEDKKKYFIDYIFDSQRKDVKSQTGILKFLALVGKNASYKTSILKSAFYAIDFISNFKINLENLHTGKVNLNDVLRWYQQKYNKSLFETQQKGKIDITNIIKEYVKEKNRDNEKALMKKYLEYFYNKSAFNKNQPLVFAVNFVDENQKNYLYNVAFYKKDNNEIEFIANLNDKEVNLITDAPKLKSRFASFHMPVEIKDRYFENSLKYLYVEKFAKNKEALTKFLKILDPSIDGIKIKEFDQENADLVIKSIEREYNNVREDIALKTLSSGTRTFIFYLSVILQNDFIIIDEIEQSLHKKLIDLLLDIARQNNKQVFFSTHSPSVVSTNLKMYEFYILNHEKELKIEKAENIFRQDKDNFLQKYLKDLVSSIDDVDVDLIRFHFY